VDDNNREIIDSVFVQAQTVSDDAFEDFIELLYLNRRVIPDSEKKYNRDTMVEVLFPRTDGIVSEFAPEN